MRKFLSLLFLLLAAFVACEEQPNVEVKKPELVLLSSETMLFEAQGGSGEIAYSLKNGVDGKSVEASCDADWVTDIAVADKIAFRVLANDKEELRTATITVSYDELSFVVNLRQAAAEPQPEPDHVVELVADKSYIKSDGEDCVTFTVFVDEQEVTTGYSITNVTTDELLEGNTFVSTEAGEYKFKATYGEYSSNEVSISVEGLDGCEVPVITADKMEIKADGVDVVTFTVTYNGEDVTAESEIKCLTTGKLLEGNTFTTTEAGEYRFDAMCDASVERSIEIAIVATATEPEPDPIPTIVLEADKLSIVADGEDKVTFTVKSDDNTLSEGFEIINLADKEPLAAAEFTTTTAGEYSFKAKVGDAESEVVKITATEPEPEPTVVVALVADKTTIVADGEDKALFTVKVDDEAVSEGFEIINLADNKPLAAAEFATTTAGEYSFKAKVGDAESEVVKITATEPEPEPTVVVALVADKTTSVADGEDKALFT
ncbi:MAG: BACON domain-containing protein, partial [Alistipes sp.]|nr:BACON domain-containing protein [Alistipes sp.]